MMSHHVGRSRGDAHVLSENICLLALTPCHAWAVKQTRYLAEDVNNFLQDVENQPCHFQTFFVLGLNKTGLVPTGSSWRKRDTTNLNP
jgi:hypothetical protein